MHDAQLAPANPRVVDNPQVIDLGTVGRENNGRFAELFTLSYEKFHATTGKHVRLVRHLPRAGVERIGRLVSKLGDRDRVWNIQVTNRAGEDVTFEFACFLDQP